MVDWRNTDVLDSNEVDMRRKIYEIFLNSVFREAQVMLKYTAEFPVPSQKSKIKHSMPTSVNESNVDDYDDEEGGADLRSLTNTHRF